LRARMFYESLAATTDLAVLPAVLGCRILRRTVQVRLGTNPAVPRDGCPVAHPYNSRSLRSAQSRKRVPIFVVSRQQFMKHPGYRKGIPIDLDHKLMGKEKRVEDRR
jgi:hypothetical protein